jgi:cell division protein FtsA
MVLKQLFIEQSKKIFTILDIGSSKIICLVASFEKDAIKIIGNSCFSANGFKNGNICDPKLAKASIIAAVDQAEKMANITIEEVILVINGNKIKSNYLTPTLNLNKQKITASDINNIINLGIKQIEKTENEVIHYFPISYNIDGNTAIKNPIGLVAKNLVANLHYVTVSSLMLENIINCLASCQLNIADCIFSPYAASLATLNINDKEFGSTLIDFGDSITSYALFSEDNLVHCGFIPIGSRAITNDIAKSFMIDFATAERIKTIHGAASATYADTNKMIKCKTEANIIGNFETEERSISNSELNEVINARLEEIFALLHKILDNQYIKFPNAKQNIILTGGGSMLTGFGEFVAKTLSAKVRHATPSKIEGIKKELTNSSYSSAIGALQYVQNYLQFSGQADQSNLSIFDKLKQWFKNNF